MLVICYGVKYEIKKNMENHFGVVGNFYDFGYRSNDIL